MPSARDDHSRYGLTEDADPAMLGALGDKRTGLDEERDAAPPEPDDIAE